MNWKRVADALKRHANKQQNYGEVAQSTSERERRLTAAIVLDCLSEAMWAGLPTAEEIVKEELYWQNRARNMRID